MTEFPAFTGNMSRQGLHDPCKLLAMAEHPLTYLAHTQSSHPVGKGYFLVGIPMVSMYGSPSMLKSCSSSFKWAVPGSRTSNALLVCSASYGVFWRGRAFLYEVKELCVWHLSGSHPHPSRWEAHSWVHSSSHAQFPWDLRWQALGAELNLRCGAGL